MKRIYEYIKHAMDVFLYTSIAIILIVMVYFLCRIFVADQFVIPSDSMSPTLCAGDRVWVNKFILGARIYNNLDAVGSSLLDSWRTRGIRKVKRNDILIFNYPIRDNKIGFKINYVYAKRCIALPGDSISILDGYYKNSNFPHTLGNKKAQACLNRTPDSLIDEGVKYTIPFLHEKYSWNIKNFGPLYVPRKGDVIQINAENVLFYSQIIEYETGKRISVNNNGAMPINEKGMAYYIFKNNYYFTAGDNIMNSCDSRYWGFVPEEYIVGVVNLVLYSKDKNTSKIRWDRVLKFIP